MKTKIKNQGKTNTPRILLLCNAEKCYVICTFGIFRKKPFEKPISNQWWKNENATKIVK